MKRREKRAVRARSGTAAKDRGLDLRWEGTLRMGLQGPAPGSREQKLFLSIPLTVSSSFSKSSSSAPMMLTGTRPGRGAPGAYGRGGLASAHSAPHLTGPPPPHTLTPWLSPLTAPRARTLSASMGSAGLGEEEGPRLGDGRRWHWVVTHRFLAQV